MFYKKRIEELEATIDVLSRRLVTSEVIAKDWRSSYFSSDSANWLLRSGISRNERVLTHNASRYKALLDYLGIEYVETPATKGFRKKEDGDEE